MQQILQFSISMLPLCRANPGSEFVVANTLAEWKKLEPNEFDFSQVFSQKVVSRFNSLPASSDCYHLLIDNICKQLEPDQVRQDVGPDLYPNCLTPCWYCKNPSNQRAKYGIIMK